MIHIDFNPDKFTDEQKQWWFDWNGRAKAATVDIVEIWSEKGEVSGDDFKTKIWRDLKNWLSENFFYGKCAYCEEKLTRSTPHAEHFRPKGKVDYKNEEGERVVPKVQNKHGIEVNHPGYFWLAYNWKNLVPSCERCNTGKGKLNQFPTQKPHIFAVELTANELAELENPVIKLPQWPNHYLLDAEDLDKLEGRQLLHPFFDEPNKHIKFGIKGIIVGLTDKGEQSIKVYDLENDILEEERYKEQRRAYDRLWATAHDRVEEEYDPRCEKCTINEKTALYVKNKILSHSKKWKFMKAICDYMDEHSR